MNERAGTVELHRTAIGVFRLRRCNVRDLLNIETQSNPKMWFLTAEATTTSNAEFLVWGYRTKKEALHMLEMLAAVPARTEQESASDTAEDAPPAEIEEPQSECAAA